MPVLFDELITSRFRAVADEQFPVSDHGMVPGLAREDLWEHPRERAHPGTLALWHSTLAPASDGAMRSAGAFAHQ